MGGCGERVGRKEKGKAEGKKQGNLVGRVGRQTDGKLLGCGRKKGTRTFERSKKASGEGRKGGNKWGTFTERKMESDDIS